MSSKAILLLLSFGLCALLIGCEDFFKQKDPLTKARTAIAERDWLGAEMVLERYLRSEEDATKRFEAWQQLIFVCSYSGTHPGTVLSYLETMLQEFAGKEQEKYVLNNLALFYERSNDNAKAILIWNAFLDLATLDDVERLFAHTKLISLYFTSGQLHALEEALEDSLNLPLPPRETALFLYDLAELKVGKEEFDEAVEYANEILSMDIDSFEPPIPHLRGRVLFLLGDILEQQKLYKDALQAFEIARDIYPNPKAVDMRIGYVKKLIK